MDLRNDRWQARREEAKAKKIGDNSSNNASSTPKTAASGESSDFLFVFSFDEVKMLFLV